jgi:hypothetical protein
MRNAQHPWKAGSAALLAVAVLVSARADQNLGDYRRVIVADRPLPVEKAAAEELVHYAGAIAGRTIEIVPLSKYDPGATGLCFFVGEQTAVRALGRAPGPWKPEEWMLRTVSNGLVAAGQDEAGSAWSMATAAGSMLAVYTLLDDVLGVRWFWPGPFGEHVPADPKAALPDLDRRQAPKFMIRSVQLGYPAYHTPGFHAQADRWTRRSRLGWTRSATFGHSWWYAFHLKTGEDFAAHPEWFALVNGKRQPPQMCTTHPEVLDRMVEYVLSNKQDIVSISPSDGGGFCQCNEETKSATHKRLGAPSCTSLDVPGYLAYDGKSPMLSDRIFTYANTVARRVREKNPAKSVGMFAYTFYSKPTVHIPKLEPNLYLSFCYQCAAHRDPLAYREWKESVAGWQQRGAKMVAREGWGGHYFLDLPWLHYDQIITNLAEDSRLGFIAAYGEGSKCFATQAPNYWALTRMMWDPDRPTRGLMDRFWSDAYGPVAPEMQAFFETYSRALDRNWEKRRMVMDNRGIAYVNLVNSWSILFPPDVIADADRRLREAEKKAPPGEYADRVAFHRVGQDYTRTMVELLDCYRRLAELGMAMEFFSAAVSQPHPDDAQKAAMLKRACELGEERERMLLAHRDWAAMDEGLYTFANDSKIRQWHAHVKQALGIDRPTALTGALIKKR